MGLQRVLATQICRLTVTKAGVFLAIGASTLLAPNIAAQSRKLNGPLTARGVNHGIREARTSPDGAWVVYEATVDTQAVGLFSVRTDGSVDPRRVLPPGTFYYRFDVSSEFVVCSDLRNLLIVPIDGSRPPSLLLPPVGDTAFVGVRSIGWMEITADGSHVIYLAGLPGVGREELFSVALHGDRNPIKLSGPPPAGIIWHSEVSPDGQRVVYLADQETQGLFEIYSAPIDGTSAPVKLNGPLVTNGDVLTHWPFQISPGGDRVVYMADQDSDEVTELYSAPIDGNSNAVKLNGPLVGSGNVRRYLISPDGFHVVYLADQEVNERDELYSAPIDGSSAPVKLNGRTRADVLIGFQISPDGSRVVYRAPPFLGPGVALYSAPIDGEGATFLLNPGASDPLVFSPDGRQVVYLAFQGGQLDLYSEPLVRGEVDARFNQSHSVLQQHPEWLEISGN